LFIKDKNRIATIIILGVATITLAMTPGINKDSLIIPKFIVLFCLALFLIPVILFNIKIMLNNTYTKILMILVLFLLIDGVLILVTSSSPIEQLVFGRMGRGLGFATFFSALLILITSSIVVKIENLDLLLKGVVTVGLLGSFYACLQFLDLDIFKWDSKTNGIIGTLGNPNSLSSFTAMIIIPAVVIFWYSKYKTLLLIVFIPIMLFTLYISESTQGYIGIMIAMLVFVLTFAWYKNKIIFFSGSLISSLIGVVAILGMLGHGPLSNYLYKISVQSRGDFWRSAFATGNSHPVFGVGFDSFGDYSLKYRDAITASHPWAEYTDSAHNFYFDYLATGGYPFLLLNISLTLLAFISFIFILKRYKSFNSKITSLFCAWVVIQLQTIINTQSITFIAWNAVITGTIIGFAGNIALRSQNNEPNITEFRSTNIMKLASIFLLILGLVIAFPFFNNDRLLVKASDTGNGDLLIRAVTSYPESTTKYSQASQALLESGLPGPSLYLAQKGLEFNSKSVSLWGLILVNQTASIVDRQNAKIKILELDPFNKEVKNFIVK
jgi:O-antigen ligase